MGFLSKAIVGFHLVKTAGLLANAAQFPVLRRGDRAPVRPRISLLVPARDEAARLPRLLPGLLAQPVEEILILDDCSTDGTADVVRASADSRLRLLTGVAPPPGWIGKNWACHQLAQAAVGDVLIFCDADILLADGAVDAIWEHMRRQRGDVFSVFPRQLTGTVGERLLVPLIDETLLAFLPHRLLDVPVRSAATANGQLLAFRRAAYDRMGGHQAVFDQILEDVALARRSRRLGLRLGLALGGDMVQARMYEDYASTVAGLGKSLRAAHAGSRALLAVDAGLHLAAYTLPWLLWRRSPAWRAAALMGVAQRLLTNAKTGRGAYAEGALVPVTPLAALPVFAVAARERASWKGRSYP